LRRCSKAQEKQATTCDVIIHDSTLPAAYSHKILERLIAVKNKCA